MSRWRRLGFWAAVSVGWVAILLPTTAPASLLAYLVDRGSGGRLQLQQPQGSLWQGRGQLTANSASVSEAEGVELRWLTLWPSIQRRSLEWKFFLQGNEAVVGIGPRGWSLDSPGMRVPLDLVRAFLPALVSRYSWRGHIQLEARGVTAVWGNRPRDGTARLDLGAIGIKELLRNPAGSYTVVATAERETLSLVLDTLEGPLELKGTGHLEGRRLVCEVKAKVPPGSHVELANLMDHVARRDGPGSWVLACG